jgi:ligand-binding SRPBCC domain-containing protein
MQFQKETRIAAAPSEVFAFHESPGALRALTPPGLRLVIREGGNALRPGSKVVLETSFGPLRLRWVAVHTEYDPPHLFADRQESGPFARWYHRHRFLDDGQGGTLLRDEIEFAPPLGLLGRTLMGWYLLRKLERLFEYRHEATRRHVERNPAGSPPNVTKTV